MSTQLIPFGWSFCLLMAGLIVIPYLARKRDLFTSWNLFLLGSANFVGLAAVSAATRPRAITLATGLNDNDYMQWILGAVTFYAVIICSYFFLAFPRRLAARHSGNWPTSQPRFLILLIVPLCIATGTVIFWAPRIPVVTDILLRTTNPLAAAALVFCIFSWTRHRWNPTFVAIASVALLYALFIAFFGGTGRRALLAVLMSGVVTLYWLRWRYLPPAKNLLRVGIGLAFALVVIAGYTTYRHAYRRAEARTQQEVAQRAIERIQMLPSAILQLSDPLRYFSGDGAVDYSLIAIHQYSKAWKPQPFFTFQYIASNWIPRRWWHDKPEALGQTLPRDLGVWRYGYVNWGPGIVGHGFHEGGLAMLVLYGFLFGACFSFFDELLRRQPDNPYLIAMLVAVSGQVIAFSRGDIANFIMQIVAGVFAVLLVTWVGRFVAVFVMGNSAQNVVGRRRRRSLRLRLPSVRQA